jgi:50S ribosomal protein L16 3-hydroxylase
MTFSLGCRAPSVSEVVAHFAQRVLEAADERERYQDPDLAPALDRHALDLASVARVGNLLRARLSFDDAAIARGFASLLTLPKALFAHDEVEPLDYEAVARVFAADGDLVRRIGSRWLLCPHGEGTSLFVDGIEFAVPPVALELSRALCASRLLPGAHLREIGQVPVLALWLRQLVRQGLLEPRG